MTDVIKFPGKAANEEPEQKPEQPQITVAERLEELAAKIRAGEHPHILRGTFVLAELKNNQRQTTVMAMSSVADWPKVFMDLHNGAMQIQNWFPE